MALGHEAAGIVEALGEGVTDLSVGDHVVLVFVPSCGRCGPCAAGRPALCEPGAKANGAGTLLSGERRLSFKPSRSTTISAFRLSPTHAVVARESCVKVDPELPFELAALFGCAVLTGVGAVVNTARVEPGASVAVVGLGGVGLSAVLGATLAGARQIVAIDLSDEKLAFARALGATDAVNAGATDAVQSVREPYGRRGRGRVRHGRRRAGARVRLRRHGARRHDRHRRPAASRQAHGARAGDAWSPRSARSRAPTLARPRRCATCRA